MIGGFEAGLSGKQIMRFVQWAIGMPIVFSFANRLLETGLPDPIHWFLGYIFLNPWHIDLILLLVAGIIELTDIAMVQGQRDYETRIHELIKAIGDRLRAGAAVETAVSESIRTTEGPSEVFAHAIELSDTVPFEQALREAADQCGSEYLREVCYLIAEAVQSEGDTGSAIRRLGMELERNHQYVTKVASKIQAPVMLMRGVGLFAVPPMYGILRWSFNNFTGGGVPLETGARLFFLYGAVGITVYDGLIFGQWERVGARLPLGVASVHIGLHLPQLVGALF